MSIPPHSAHNPPDGGAHEPMGEPFAGGPGGDETRPYGDAPHRYPQPGEVGYAAVAPPSSGRAAGWVGVAVLYVLAIWQLVIPTVATFVQSLSSGNPITGGEGFVGLENWSNLMPQMIPALGFSILAVLPVTIVAAVLGFVIGAAMAPHQRFARLTRILVGVLAALFVPVGIGMSRFLAVESLASPAQARSFLVLTITLTTLPLLTAAFATAFAFVLPGSSPGRGIALVLVLGVTGALALGSQLFDLPLVFTGGGPQHATQTPMLLAYRQGFMIFDFGSGAAASGVVLLLAGALGIVAMLALVVSRTQLEVRDEPADQNGRTGSGGAIGVIGASIAVVALLAAVVLHLPVLAGGFSTGPDDAVSPIRVALATWAPGAAGTLLQVGIAVLGGAAIGWYRPAGRRSMWLLLPLAPWLFVGPAPLMLHSYTQFQELGLLDTWLGLFPTPLVVVGAVVLLTLVFAGLRDRPQRSGRQVVGAAALGAAGVLLVTQAQSLLPGLVLNVDPANDSAPMAFMRMIGAYGWQGYDNGWLLGMLYPIPMFLLVAALGVLAQLGLRRVVARHD